MPRTRQRPVSENRNMTKQYINPARAGARAGRWLLAPLAIAALSACSMLRIATRRSRLFSSAMPISFCRRGSVK